MWESACWYYTIIIIFIVCVNNDISPYPTFASVCFYFKIVFAVAFLCTVVVVNYFINNFEKWINII